MKRLVMTVVAAGAALTAAAMPTKKELQKAQEMVADVTEADVKALKSGAKKPAEVAAKHMELAAQAGSEAEKYLLLQGAFKLYAKAGDYDAAADALGTMNREIADMNPEVIVDIYNKAIFSSMKEKAPKLHAIKEAARRQVTYRKLLAKAEAAVKASPKDPGAQKKLGECHAELGDWTKALDAFALAGGTLAKTAKAESDGSLKPQELGDFWWDYSDAATYRLHAAALYRTALADNSFKGLARTRADQRMKEVAGILAAVMPGGQGASPRPPAAATPSAGSIELKTGGNSPFTVKGNEATLTLKNGAKLAFVKCPSGWVKVVDDYQKRTTRRVKITRPFWIMKRLLSKNDVRGTGDLEKSRPCLDTGFIEPSLSILEGYCAELSDGLKSVLPSGYVVRVPSIAEWEYAYHAGSDDPDDQPFGTLLRSYWGVFKHGAESPKNKWGLCEFHDVEKVLDRIDRKDLQSFGQEEKRVARLPPSNEREDLFYWTSDLTAAPYLSRWPVGERLWMEAAYDHLAPVRLVIGPDLVSEWKAKNGKK